MSLDRSSQHLTAAISLLLHRLRPRGRGARWRSTRGMRRGSRGQRRARCAVSRGVYRLANHTVRFTIKSNIIPNTQLDNPHMLCEKSSMLHPTKGLATASITETNLGIPSSPRIRVVESRMSRIHTTSKHTYICLGAFTSRYYSHGLSQITIIASTAVVRQGKPAT